MDAVNKGNFEIANKLLENDSKWEKHERNKLLFYLNKADVLWMQGDYINSNIYFRKADYFIEDYRKNYGLTFFSLLVNPNVLTYPGEDFEQILIHYYGSLNYLALNQYDEALVEGKRMLEKMQRITDKYQSKNKYKRDAFAHNLIGVIYDAKGEYNDAFIAYRNALEIYKDDYLKNFGTGIPVQLKRDLLRAAYRSGFYEEVRKYEKEFNLVFDEKSVIKRPEIIFFWNNGLGPVKDQNSFNFSIIPLNNMQGWIQFVNWDLGMQFPFNIGNDEKLRKSLLNMKFVRLALPKFVTRKPYYSNATARINGVDYNFCLAEDVNAIAFKNLSDRMLIELGEALLRVAIKQLAVYEAGQSKDKNAEAFALAATLYGAFSEQADTRNWQLLPYSINYCRMPADTGRQTVFFQAYNKAGEKGFSKNLDLNLKIAGTKILSIQTLETLP